MPPVAQEDIVSSVVGLENAVILRYGYAIEYDALAPGQFHKTMESRVIKGLYTAGQINGTSGYEEAAGQGLIAGINAILSLRGEAPYWPSRTRSYLGVLVDDLSTWSRNEPYRITPGHAEYRITLRDDSAERRLIEDGYRIGLVSKERYEKIVTWKKRIEDEIEALDTLSLLPNAEAREIMAKTGTGELRKPASGAELLQRPGMNYKTVTELLHKAADSCLTASDEIYALETEIKYRGYADRELERIKQTAFLESIRLPMEISDERMRIINKEALEIMNSERYDDLSQMVRMNHFSKSELAVLLAILNGEELEEEQA